jgi:hypothetical protein
METVMGQRIAASALPLGIPNSTSANATMPLLDVLCGAGSLDAYAASVV